MTAKNDSVSAETVFGRHTARSLTALLSNWTDRITTERGVRYARDDAARVIHHYRWDDRTFILEGEVHGSDEAPYQTVVRLFPEEEDWGDMEGECSCPVKWDCKHAVALVWQWATQSGVLSAEASGVAEPEVPPGKTTRRRQLTSSVDQWLEKTNLVADAVSKPTRAASSGNAADELVYTLTPDGVLSAVKVRATRSSGYKRASSSASLAWLRHDHKPPSYVTPSDEPILRLMAAAQQRHQFTPDLRLVGQTGYQLLRMALATGRVYFAASSEALTLGTPLSMQTPQPGALGWQRYTKNKAEGVRLMFTPEGSTEPLPMLATEPALALDSAHSALIPVETGLSVQSLERLLALPLLSESDITAWRFVRDAWSQFPDAKHIPPLPFPLEPLPQPIGILRFALVEISVSQGWGKHQKTSKVVAPAVEFSVQYGDQRRFAVLPHDYLTPIEEELVDGQVVSTFVRNTRAERAWALRLPPRLMPLHEVEPALTYAVTNVQRHSLFALPRHTWTKDGPQVLAEAQAAGFRLEIEAGFPLTLEDIPEPTLELVPAAQNGWYRFALGVDVGGMRVDLAPAFARVIGAQRDPQAWVESLQPGEKILLSLDDGRVVRLDGARVRAMLEPVLAWFQGGTVESVSELQAALLPAPVVYRGRDHAAWLALREKLQAGAKLEPVVPTAQFSAPLRPYQLSGLAWLHHLHTLKMGGVLADDMGLGKTVQTLAHLDRLRSEATTHVPSLIVAPTSVISNWRAEAKRFAPALRVHVHHGKDRTLSDTVWQQADVVVTSYPILQRDAAAFAKLSWNAVVFDEAQTLKNPRAKTYHAAQGLNAQQRLALTGTPMENHLGELWSLFNVLSPGLLGDLETFNRHFRHRIEQNSDGERLAVLRARVRPFLLRRTREEVVKELPEKTETIRWIDLDAAQADLYETLRTAIHDEVRKAIDRKGLKQSTIHILDALLKLRQACCDPQLVRLPDGKRRTDVGSAKLEWLTEHVPILIEEGRKILIFSQFTSMLEIIEARLAEAGLETVVLTGDTRDRDTPIRRFQNGEVPVFLLSLKAGGVGLNLTAADTVIHYDPWWNPAVEAQATARAHRIGQDKPVFVYKLIARGTLEERMLALIERKQQLAEALLSGGSAALTGMTEKDVDDLLAPIESLVPVEKA